MDTTESIKVISKEKAVEKLIILLDSKYPNTVSYKKIYYTCINGNNFTCASVYNLISRTRKFLENFLLCTRILTVTGEGYRLYYPHLYASN